ncbi:MAG: hypothetical protein KY433_08195, partial [Actinobacteria bacterium]|nr:hypothetical protein [Actinomycetota bacterium]
MTIALVLLSIVVAVLVLLVAGLLRSHAAILRRLHELGAGHREERHAGPGRREGRHRIEPQEQPHACAEAELPEQLVARHQPLGLAADDLEVVVEEAERRSADRSPLARSEARTGVAARVHALQREGPTMSALDHLAKDLRTRTRLRMGAREPTVELQNGRALIEGSPQVVGIG